MTRQKAYQSFVYHSDRIITPLGKADEYHERMRTLYAKVYDSGYYKQLPNDVLDADEFLWNNHNRF